MWITQTYLASVEPHADLFIYYFFEDYNEAQKRFTERVQRELEKLGDVYGEKISLFMPNKKYAGKIEAEVREYRELWMSLRGKLPGIFISRKPLVQLTAEDDGCVFIPFENRDARSVAATIQRIRGIADDTLSHDFAQPPNIEKKTITGRIADSIEWKPGIWGIRLDLRRLFRR